MEMMIRPGFRTPDWRNMARILEKGTPGRPTLFELFFDDDPIQSVTGRKIMPNDYKSRLAATIRAHDLLGYDCVVIFASAFRYPSAEQRKGETISLNDGFVITDRNSFDKYPWPDNSGFDNTWLDAAAGFLPGGMRLLIWSDSGLLETVIRLTGYENLCYMIYDDEQLVSDIFERVGKGYLEYFRRCVEHPAVLALISSDDWGFKTQTLLPTAAMRKYLFPWQQEYVRLAHHFGKYAILHSCGYFDNILDDILEAGFDARHSYEDAIVPVEDAYRRFGNSIAVLGGIDLDFLARSTPGAIGARSKDMLLRTEKTGGYALGSGNSIPKYVPFENYLAMTKPALSQ